MESIEAGRRTRAQAPEPDRREPAGRDAARAWQASLAHPLPVSPRELAATAVLMAGVLLSARYNYALFHTLAELLAVVVATTFAVVALTAHRTLGNQYIAFIGLVFLSVGLLDLLHALSFQGLPLFSDQAFYAPQLWLAARMVQSAGILLAIPLIGSRRLFPLGWTVAGLALLTAGLAASILVSRSFPVCFVPGQGLTAFKIHGEYAVCLLLVTAVVLLYRRRTLIDARTHALLQAALLLMVVVDLCFTTRYFSTSMSDVPNLLGHLTKICAFLLIYKAVVVTALRDPVEILFRDLKASHAALRAAKEAAEQGLRDETLLLGAIVESSQDAIFSFDGAGRIMNWNRGAARLLGHHPAVIVGAQIATLVPARFQGPWGEWMTAIAAGTAVGGQELRLLHADGSEVDVSVSLSPLYRHDGARIGGSIIVRSTVEQRASERALARDRQRLATILRTASDGIHILDSDGLLIEANDAFLAMLGHEPSAIGRLRVTDWDTESNWAEIKQRNDALVASRGHQVFETVHRCSDGRQIDVEISATGIEIDGRGYLYAASRDITDRKRAEREIRQLALYDALTGLPNRRLLMDRLKLAAAALDRARRSIALLFIDLDNFKHLNDTAGHDKGDLLLRQVAELIQHCVREGDTVARLGGDEFVVMLPELSVDPEAAAGVARMVAEKILSVLSRTYQLDGYRHHMSASIGITLFERHGEPLEEPLKRADLAMYEAKNAGRNTIRFFDPRMQAIATARAALEADFRHALVEGQFELHFQPQVTANGRLHGVEALIRWRHPQQGLVLPGKFIPLAEETGLILPMGRWVIEAVSRQLVDWSTHPFARTLRVGVNVSARQFQHPAFVDEVLATLRDTGADPRLLKLELTESLLLSDVDAVIAKMNTLKREGIGLALDDFGTGYSSLSVLKALPLDELKIDGAFVRDILSDPDDAAIASMVVALADRMGLLAVAECVETREQQDVLIGQGCDIFQGFLFGRPMPAGQLLATFSGRAADAVIG